jgi:hypothetical protein
VLVALSPAIVTCSVRELMGCLLLQDDAAPAQGEGVASVAVPVADQTRGTGVPQQVAHGQWLLVIIRPGCRARRRPGGRLVR